MIEARLKSAHQNHQSLETQEEIIKTPPCLEMLKTKVQTHPWASTEAEAWTLGLWSCRFRMRRHGSPWEAFSSQARLRSSQCPHEKLPRGWQV